MGPFVPDIITNELNLIVGFLIGIAFGFVLEQAGFSSSRKLTGLFYGTDFTVLRVFFSAGVTAMCGVTILSLLGLLDTSVIYIHPTYLYSALIGGAVMGIGFVVGGYCPGTSFCGAAIGKIDAMIFILGGTVGVFLFAEAFPWISNLYAATSFGDVTAHSLLGLTPGVVGLAVIVVAIGAFVATSWLEGKVNPEGPAHTFSVRKHMLVAAGVLILGIVLAMIPSYQSRLTQLASSQSYQAEHPVERMTADELAFRFLDDDPNLLVIDVRSPEAVQEQGLPGAINLTMDQLFGKQWRDVLASRKQKIFIARDGAEAIQAATLAKLLGYDRVHALDGGWREFAGTILGAARPEGELASNEQTVIDFRIRAAAEISQMIAERGKVEPAQRKVKKVIGGCGL